MILQLKCTKGNKNYCIKYSCQNYKKKKKINHQINHQNYLNRKRNQGKESSKLIDKNYKNKLNRKFHQKKLTTNQFTKLPRLLKRKVFS